MRVSINIQTGNYNAERVCKAYAEGISAVGDKAILRTDKDADMNGYDAAVFWGYWQNCQRIVKVCERDKKPYVYVDLGYWRRERGYFKAAMNHRHPTKYLMSKSMPHDRWQALDMNIASWKRNGGKTVVVAGMSGKGAWSWGMEGGQYEKGVIDQLRQFSTRPIVYRPKPNWHQAVPIVGSDMDRLSPIATLLHRAHCVVTHHSNVGCDAVVAGVPVLTRHAAALHMGLPDTDLKRVENPCYPEGREQWAANLAYCQWTLEEMRYGVAWRHMKPLLGATMQ